MAKAKTKSRWIPLRVLSVNVHMGLGLFAGVIPWLLSHLPLVHIVMIQEASRPRARAALVKAFPPEKWIRSKIRGQGDDPLVGTFVFARKRRFELLNTFNEVISKARPKVDGKDMFPQRNLIAVELLDKRTGRIVLAQSQHTWHIVGRKLGDGTIVSAGHERQVENSAKFFKEHATEGGVSVSAGDWNESIKHEWGPHSARAHMKEIAGMVPARGDRAHLDECFYHPKPYIKLEDWRYIDTPFSAMDHPVLLTTFKVQKA